MMNKLFFLFFLLIFSCNQSVVPNNATTQNEILWDTWGIPHIYASSEYDLYKMAAWAQMRNHGDLILKLYGEARGKSAEYWGVELARDKMLHRLGLIENSQKNYANLPTQEKQIIEAFADGINAFVKANPTAIAEKYKVVLPIKPKDVLAHSFRVLYFEFLISRELKRAKNIKAGSNAWAISPSHTDDGNALLLANPHLPWYDFWLFFEAQYTTKDNDIYGTTLVGLPTIAIGFNKNLGWTHTVNTLDNVDLFELEIKDGKYLMDGQYHDFDIREQRISSNENGKLASQTLIIKKSKHGVVIREMKDKAIAIRYPNMDGSMNMYKQWTQMGKAKSLSQFEAAMKINTIPLFNTIYADKEGNIMHHFAGNVPIKQGDWTKWQGIVSGNDSKSIWTDYYDYEQLPHLLNPKSGWLQNANDPPYTNTIPTELNPSDYPSHISPTSMSFRPQRSAAIMKSAGKLNLEKLIQLKHNTKSELALRLKDDIADLKNHTKDGDVLAAINLLNDWDGSFDADSKATVLFINFINNLAGYNVSTLFEIPWDFKNPIQTPDGFKDKNKTIAALKKAGELQQQYFKSLEVNYGDVFRVKVGEHEFPANGGFGHLGLFRTVAFQQKEDGKFYAFHGDGFVCAIEFGDQIKAKGLLGYGNATQAGNKHVGDQLELFSQKKLRTIWHTKAEVKKHLELEEKF